MQLLAICNSCKAFQIFKFYFVYASFAYIHCKSTVSPVTGFADDFEPPCGS